MCHTQMHTGTHTQHMQHFLIFAGMSFHKLFCPAARCAVCVVCVYVCVVCVLHITFDYKLCSRHVPLFVAVESKMKQAAKHNRTELSSAWVAKIYEKCM